MNSRRNFLKLFGTGVALASANPLAAGISRLKSPNRTLKVGVLLPQSNICTQYPYSFMNGLRLGLDQNNALKKQHIEIVNEPNGYGTPFISKQNAQKLLYENHVDLLTGILSNEVVGQFEDMFSKKQTPFIVCNAGEHYPVSTLQNNKYLLFNTLNFTQSAYHTGSYATEQYGKRGFIVTSLYDSGYDSLYAFTIGAENAGGKMEETLVMNPNETDAVSKAIARIKEVKPDFVYVLLSGENAQGFIVQYNASGENNIPLLSTPFVTEKTNLPQLGQYATGLETVTPWIQENQNNENQEFIKKYLKEYRAEPDMFAVLGYETGLITYQALANCNGNFSGENLQQNLMKASIASPRGSLTFNGSTGYTETPMYRIKVDNSLFSSIPKSIVEEKLHVIAANNNELVSLDNPMRSGWFNPYLFV